MLQELSERARELFREIVETYCETGDAIGSANLSRRSGLSLSPASIRSIMAQLETIGLLYSPHTSAGRLPTELGIKVFVEGLMQVGSLNAEEEKTLQDPCKDLEGNVQLFLERTVSALSGLTRCAGLVVAPKIDSILKHIEFLSVGSGRALVILVNDKGGVENRVISVPEGLPPATLVEASNYLNARLKDHSMTTVRNAILKELNEGKQALDSLTQKVIEAGLGIWHSDDDLGHFIVKGQSNLLEDVQHLKDLEHLKVLFEELETKENLLRLLDASIAGEGVKLYIGSENALFNLSGCSLIVSSYRSKNDRVIGAIGVIGPKHISYARIIPMVDYTAKMISQLLD